MDYKRRTWNIWTKRFTISKMSRSPIAHKNSPCPLSSALFCANTRRDHHIILSLKCQVLWYHICTNNTMVHTSLLSLLHLSSSHFCSNHASRTIHALHPHLRSFTYHPLISRKSRIMHKWHNLLAWQKALVDIDLVKTSLLNVVSLTCP